MKAMPTICALAVLLLAAVPPAATAQAEGAVAGGAARTLAGPGLTLDEAVARMERKFKARAVRVEEKRRDGRTVYRIRLLSDDGRVFDVEVDAATGAVE